ncbi:hypothetical protein F2Q70_00022010 [Brassica cretica]|uniref:Uncharacterized protein n=1 Tax=Brassica cretica TaxID=69181 RepID=A0A8S9GPD3_BRACR|nr:hypothetical protein F2Q70_00022010 [Brassica cretica]KAF2555938.1 hypothetical protein F2Q68_00015799 [Brassica cretica]
MTFCHPKFIGNSLFRRISDEIVYQSRDGSGQHNEAEALDDKGEEILGSFENAEVRCSDGERAKGDKVKRYYELTFEKKLREKVMGPYLRHVVAISEESKKSLRVVIIAKVWRRATDALVALV